MGVNSDQMLAFEDSVALDMILMMYGRCYFVLRVFVCEFAKK